MPEVRRQRARGEEVGGRLVRQLGRGVAERGARPERSCLSEAPGAERARACVSQQRWEQELPERE